MPEPKSPFRPSFLKIERAQRHLAELEGVAKEYLEGTPAEIAHKALDPMTDLPKDFPPELKGRVIIGWNVSVKTNPPPEEMGAIIGDIFHNLRSALDLMASTLVALTGQSVSKVYFPFAGDADGLEEQIVRKRFDRAGQEAVRLLREWAPYRGGNLELRAIHDLNVRDKHQELVIQRTQVTTHSPAFDLKAFEMLPETQTHTVQLLFPNDCALAEKELISTLHKLVDLTASVVESFESLRAPTG